MLKKKDEEGEGEEEHEKDLEKKTFKRYDIEMQFNQDNPDTWTCNQMIQQVSDHDLMMMKMMPFSSWTELQRSRRRWFLSGTKSRTVSS